MLYAATSAGCGGAPNGVWAIDLDSETKPVVSWKTNGGPVVGAVAFAPDGTLFAAIGAGQTTGDGKANAIVALDPKTLQVKDWFTQPGGGVRDRADHPSSQRQGHRRRGDQGRPHSAARRDIARRRGSRDASSRVEDVAGTRGRRSALMRSRPGSSRRRRRTSATRPLDSAARRRPRWRVARIRERSDLDRRRDRPEADRRRRRALAGAGMGLAQPLGAGHADHGQRRGVRAGDRTCRPHRPGEARRPCSTRTTARRADGSGPAARR